MTSTQRSRFRATSAMVSRSPRGALVWSTKTALPPIVLMPDSNARRVRRLAFSNISTICFASRAWRYSRGLLLTSWPSFRVARTSALERSAMEHRSSPAMRAAAARMSGSFSTETAASLRSMVALLAMMFSSCGRTVRRGVFGEKFVQRGNRRIDVAALQNVRRQEAQHGIAGAVDENAALEHLRHSELGKFCRIEFSGDHQAFSAHVDNRLMLAGKRPQAFHEIVAHFSGVRQQPFLLHGVDDRDADRASQRAAAKCGAVHTRVYRACNFLRAHNCSERNTASERLGECGHIGLDAVVLVGTPLAGAAHASLNLIDNQQCARGTRERACLREELLRQRPHA